VLCWQDTQQGRAIFCSEGLPHKQRLLPLIIFLSLLRLKVYGDKDTTLNYFFFSSYMESFLASRQKEPNPDDNNSFPDEIKRITEEKREDLNKKIQH
jgi:hypothetical protein